MYFRLEDEEKKKEQDPGGMMKEMLDTRTIIIAEEISPELSRRVLSQLILLNKRSEKEPIYVYINSFEYYKNIQFALEKSNITTLECVFNNSTEPNMLAGITGACELVGKGWEKEAIPINHKKKSFISGFFSKLFS